MHRGPAYRIETRRLTLTSIEPRDAQAWSDAVAASTSELRPFVPWARDEPLGLDERLEQMRALRAEFDRDETLSYAIRERGAPSPASARPLVGAASLLRGDGSRWREIGYWIATPSTSRGFAFEACAALLRVAFEVERHARVELRCDPDNERSRALAAKLGFTCDGTLRSRIERRDGSFAADQHWSLLRQEFDRGAVQAAAADASAFDALDRPLMQPIDATPRARSAFD